jgi:hypothetical protein
MNDDRIHLPRLGLATLLVVATLGNPSNARGGEYTPFEGAKTAWRGCYWDHEPQTEVELLRRGFHVAFVTPNPARSGNSGTRSTGSSPSTAFPGSP